MSLRTKSLFASVVMVFLFSGMCFSAGPGGEGNFYISKKYDAAGWDGNIKSWHVTIDYLALIKTDGTVVPVMTSSVTLNLLSADAGQISGHFKIGASIPVGNYKQVRISQGSSTQMRGWILEGGVFYRTKNDDPNCVIAPNVDAAEDSAEEITIDHGEGATDDVPEVPDPDKPIVIEEGKSYELRIIWTAIGLESGNGVGLVLNGAKTAFLEGMLCEQYVMHNNTDGTDQFFTALGE